LGANKNKANKLLIIAKSQLYWDRSEVKYKGEVSRCVEVKSNLLLRGSLLGVIAIRRNSTE